MIHEIQAVKFPVNTDLHFPVANESERLFACLVSHLRFPALKLVTKHSLSIVLPLEISSDRSSQFSLVVLQIDLMKNNFDDSVTNHLPSLLLEETARVPKEK